MAARKSATRKPGAGEKPAPGARDGVQTLTIDIGGTGVKMLVVDAKGKATTERARELTPKPSTPDAVLAVIRKMLLAQAQYDRVSVGFPGVVVRGVVQTAPNLGTEEWRDFDLKGAIEHASGKPTGVANDADLQGYGVISGTGVELVLTLGTGLGTGLYVDGHLVPNLELAHHPLRKGKSYEELVSNSELKRIGKKKWVKRVLDAIDQMEPIFNYDTLHIGGGNAKHLKEPLPAKVRIFNNVEGLAGGVRLWHDT